jgi:mannose-6-phosphate isomerase-like protein (cupin superfamily)
MKQMDRRELAFALSAFTAFGVVRTEAQSGAQASEGAALAHSEIFAFDNLPVHTAPNGMATRAVLRGNLTTGEFVEVHETTLPPGEMPHPPHRHTHSEFLLIREGRLEVNSDGQHGFVEAGGVIFTASGVLHSLKNVGSIPAKYFVVAVGVQKIID